MEIKTVLVAISKNSLGVNYMTVGKKDAAGRVVPVNVIEGQRAVDIWNELTIVKKPNKKPED